jgi:hypothetical protein
MAKFARPGIDTLKAWGPRHADGKRRLALPAVDVQDAGAEHFRQNRRAVKTKANDGRTDRRQSDADVGQAEVQDEQLGQDRDVTEDFQVNARQRTQDPAAGKTHQRQSEPQQCRDNKRRHCQPHGRQSTNPQHL